MTDRVMFNIRLDAATREQLADEAEHQDRSMNFVANEAIEQYLRRRLKRRSKSG